MYSYVEGICKQCLEDDVIPVLSGLYTQLTCHSFNMFLMHWFGVCDNIFQSLPISERVAQHSAGYSQEELDLFWVFKETCCTALGKWWSCGPKMSIHYCGQHSKWILPLNLICGIVLYDKSPHLWWKDKGTSWHIMVQSFCFFFLMFKNLTLCKPLIQP